MYKYSNGAKISSLKDNKTKDVNTNAKRLLLVSIGWLLCSAITGQNLTTRNITLEQAIEIAHARSPQVQMAQLNFMAQYWDFRSYKAQFLPSLNLHGNLGNYNRSLVDVRDPETGAYQLCGKQYIE